ncbi:MAG: agarase [Chitinophagia bacterium]|jgi:hypothetical protein
MYRLILLFAPLIFSALPVVNLEAQIRYSDSVVVQAKIWSRDANRNIQYSDWKNFTAHTIDQVIGIPALRNENLDKWGGNASRVFSATGFFRVEKLAGKWEVIDPAGHPFLVTAINSIRLGNSATNQSYFKQLWSSRNDWMTSQIKMFQSYGFNTAGCWSDTGSIRAYNDTSLHPFAYTTQLNWLAGYTREAIRNNPARKSASVLSFILDSAFESYCNLHAVELQKTSKDPNLLGHFSDNEIAFSIAQLDSLLTDQQISPSSERFLNNWIEENGTPRELITSNQKEKLLGKIAQQYFKTVSTVLKKNDPNHLYLGSRLHAAAKNNRYIFEGAAAYVDLVSINYYGYWEPKSTHLSDWGNWGDRPFFITEFYTKAMDSGMDNMSGAGWLVKTQEERGIHYQNFCLRLFSSANCVGWHWFRYQDNDPGDNTADPSNRDANKGLVNTQYQLYVPLANRMKELNLFKYQLSAFIFANIQKQ